MAVTVTPVGNPTVFGDKHVRIVDLVFSGNYATGGEALTAATVGLPTTVQFVLFDGPAVSTDRVTSNALKYDYATSKVLFYEAAATGLALLEKTNAEAFPTGSTVRAIISGF